MRRKKTLWTAMALFLCAFGLTGCQNGNQNGNKMGISTEKGTTGLTETDPVKENTGDNGSVNSVTSGSEGSSEGVLDKMVQIRQAMILETVSGKTQHRSARAWTEIPAHSPKKNANAAQRRKEVAPLCRFTYNRGRDKRKRNAKRRQTDEISAMH